MFKITTGLYTNIFECGKENNLLNLAWNDSCALIVILWLGTIFEAQIVGGKNESLEIKLNVTKMYTFCIKLNHDLVNF